MRNYVNYTIFSAEGEKDTGINVLCEDFKNAVFSLSSATNATFKIKFQGSISDSAPSFDAAQTATNQWDYIQIVDLENGDVIDGDTGVSFTDDDVRQFEANINGLRWINATITDYTDGAITLITKLYNNQ